MSREIQDTVNELIDLLKRQTGELHALAEVMAKNRSSFVSLGASQLLDGLDGPAKKAEDIDRMEERRHELIAQLGRALHFDGDFRVSRIVPLLPRGLGQRLQDTCQRLDKAARNVRAESIAGQRLLRLSERTNAGILEALAGTKTAGVVYDARAQTHVSTPGGKGVAGSLISGQA